jgi:hypothetical protein
LPVFIVSQVLRLGSGDIFDAMYQTDAFVTFNKCVKLSSKVELHRVKTRQSLIESIWEVPDYVFKFARMVLSLQRKDQV